MGLELRLLSGIGARRAQRRQRADLDKARAEFEAAWRIFLPKRTGADFQAWRDHQALTAWKYGMHDRGLPLPTQSTSGRSRCFCGAEIDNKTAVDHIRACHMKEAAN